MGALKISILSTVNKFTIVLTLKNLKTLKPLNTLKILNNLKYTQNPFTVPWGPRKEVCRKFIESM